MRADDDQEYGGQTVEQVPAIALSKPQHHRDVVVMDWVVAIGWNMYLQ